MTTDSRKGKRASRAETSAPKKQKTRATINRRKRTTEIAGHVDRRKRAKGKEKVREESLPGGDAPRGSTNIGRIGTVHRIAQQRAARQRKREELKAAGQAELERLDEQIALEQKKIDEVERRQTIRQSVRRQRAEARRKQKEKEEDELLALGEENLQRHLARQEQSRRNADETERILEQVNRDEAARGADPELLTQLKIDDVEAAQEGSELNMRIKQIKQDVAKRKQERLERKKRAQAQKLMNIRAQQQRMQQINQQKEQELAQLNRQIQSASQRSAPMVAIRTPPVATPQPETRAQALAKQSAADRRLRQRRAEIRAVDASLEAQQLRNMEMGILMQRLAAGLRVPIGQAHQRVTETMRSEGIGTRKEAILHLERTVVPQVQQQRIRDARLVDSRDFVSRTMKIRKKQVDRMATLRARRLKISKREALLDMANELKREQRRKKGTSRRRKVRAT